MQISRFHPITSPPTMFSWLRGQAGEDAPSDDYTWVSPPPTSSSHSSPRQQPQPGHPLKLVDHNASTGTFELGSEALQVLRSINGPIAVVALCGRARQGKSYILNQLLGKSTGFQVASTHRPCTKGLWMWSHPLPRRAPDGSKYHLVSWIWREFNIWWLICCPLNHGTRDGPVHLFELWDATGLLV